MEPQALPKLPLSVRLRRLLNQPSDAVTTPTERRRAATLASLLLTFISIALLNLLVAIIVDDNVMLMLYDIAIITIAYCLSRTRYYTVGGVLALVGLWLSALGLIFQTPQFGARDMLLFIEAIVSVMFIAILLYSQRRVLILIGLTFVGISAAVLMRPNGEALEMLLLAISFFAMLFGLVLVVALIRREDVYERDRVELSLREREERYRLITEVMSDYAYSVLPSLKDRWEIEWVEGAWTTITGIPIERAKQTDWRTFLLPEDIPILEKRMEELIANKPAVVEYRIRRADGQIRWIRDYGYPVWDEVQKRVIRIYGAGQDITTRKNAELEAQEHARLAGSLRDTAAILSSTLDQDEVLNRILDEIYRVIPSDSADIMLIDNGITRLVRVRGGEKYGVSTETLTDFTIAPDDLPNLKKMYETGSAVIIPDTSDSMLWVDLPLTGWVRTYLGVPIVLDGITMGFINLMSARVGQFTHNHAIQLRAFADQAAVAIRNAVLFDEVQRYADALSIIVTERNNELSFERERLRVILEATAEGVIYTENSIFLYVNPAFAQLTGYTPTELIGQPVTILASPESSQSEMTEFLGDMSAQLENGTWRGAMRMTRKDGSTFICGMTISPIARDEVATRAVTIARDITREKILQQQQSQFVAHASHELRTPITNFKTRLHLLRRDPANLENHLAVMDEVTERMRRLVNDLLDLTRFERGIIPLNLREQPLQALLEIVVRDQISEADQKSLTLRLTMPSIPLIARVDDERIIQVITNIVTNAINYTPIKGDIHISLHAQPDAGSAMITVEDTGVGISPAHLPLIFQPFYRVASSVEGTGLGLSIAREIIEQHGGTINVNSQVDIGSRFEITLNLVDGASVDTAHAQLTENNHSITTR